MRVDKTEFIIPDWKVPPGIMALCTTRIGGVSQGGFESFNLATHVGDVASHVSTNRALLRQALNLPCEPQWLEQTHSTHVVDLDSDSERQGDAAITSSVGQIAVVLTADCLPVLLCNRQGTQVAASHAGWRGLLNGVLEQTVSAMRSEPAYIQAWLGPAIGAQQFEVGAEVRAQFVQQMPASRECFRSTRPGHYLADLYALAALRLKKQGLTTISGGGFCTFSEAARFYSYRREKVTGRQASLIYIKK